MTIKTLPRFDHLQAPRSIPETNMPPGPSHNLAANYYFTRDGRREVRDVMSCTFYSQNIKVAPPAVLADGNKALSSGEESAAVAPRVCIDTSLAASKQYFTCEVKTEV